MKEPYRSTWRVYLPGLFMMSMFSVVVYFSRTRSDVVKNGYDFVPIYSEDGKLEGFTHPVLVKAGNQYRESDGQRGMR
ncbi:hypothetical protein JKF63_03426 [Porcisia hertigi]|uniref:Uncharacterized protein n=1 Tax=Porcisia hertigi TaxID=2761500 RepID=A0A836HZM8_9TRYP|nr:hypothetical protein JKF63_03426 [Porcisia hertigi]